MVFAVAAGAAVAAVGLEPVAALGAVVLAAGLAGLAAVTVVPSFPSRAGRLAGRAARLGAAVAVVLPLVASLGLEIGGRMTAPIAAEARMDLDRITGKAQVLIGAGESADAAADDAEAGFFGRFTENLDDAFGAVRDYRDAAGVFFSEADALFEAAMTLIGVFVLQTVVLPVLLFWGAMSILRRSLD